MKLASLDDTDRKLLFELDKNSRTNISLLSKKLKISRDRISYRLKRYQDLGILKRCTVTVDPYKFGLCVYKTYIKLSNDKKRRAMMFDSFQTRAGIYWFAETEGHWDAIFAVYARSLFEFNLIQDQIFEEFGDLIQEFQVYSLVDAWFFRKNYLVDVGSGYFKIGGKPEYSETDHKDIEILSLLAEEARISVVDIGERIGASSTLVNARIEKMEKAGIIVGYRTELDLSLLGITSFKSRLFVNQHDRNSLSNLFDYARLNPYLTLLMRQIGDCKVEVEYDVQNYDHYVECIDDLREKFPKLIRHIETIGIKKQTYQWMSLQAAKRSDNLNRLIGELTQSDERRDFLRGK